MSDRATREAFGATLVELAAEGVDVVAVEADLSKSTTTAVFAEAYPERFFNAGVAEQNMIGVAAGLAVAGKVAFTGSFAVFATGRAYDQVRNTVCYSGLDVKLAPTHAGVTVGPDGGSHQMLEDIALMRVLPGMRVLVPADYVAAREAIRLAASTPGPFYVRLGRAPVPAVYGEGFTFELGAAHVLREGGDVTLAACGLMVERALAAADLLAADGIFAEVIDVSTVKPIDAETIARSAAKT
ncbi:MAG TPA: transketolase C-terminal domain-containing protein, partial [Coriobacteriia bacterium]|nr:transketolase C-terminal domain-containing protein [Coriobacteriia bacterium]